MELFAFITSIIGLLIIIGTMASDKFNEFLRIRILEFGVVLIPLIIGTWVNGSAILNMVVTLVYIDIFFTHYDWKHLTKDQQESIHGTINVIMLLGFVIWCAKMLLT